LDKSVKTADSEAAALRRLWAQFSARRRGQLFLVLGAMLAGAFAEVLSLGALVPFLAAMANPQKVMSLPYVEPVLIALGLAGQGDLLVVLTVLFSIAVILSAVFRIVLNWATNQYGFLIGHDLGMKLYERVLYQPYRWHTARNSSEIIGDINKVQAVTNGLVVPLMQTVSSAFMGLFIIAALLFVSPVITLAAFVSFGLLYYAVSQFNRHTLRATGKVMSRSHKERVQAVQEGVGGIRDVLLDGSQRVFLNRFRRVDLELRDAQAVSSLIGTTPRFLIEGVGMILIACFALYLTESPGGFIGALPVLGAIALGAQRLLPLLQLGYQSWTRVASNAPTLEDVLAILERPIPASAGQPIKPLPFARAIEFRDVSFRYADDTAPVLSGTSFTIAKGERIGVVGKTGSGKSTLVDLLMGLLEPSAGAIAVDGVELDDVTRRAWQRQIAHVPQSIFLADASIAENIAFGLERSAIDMEAVREAARLAEISEFVEGLPKGYETTTGERGVRLSGGQRQRIGIARALFKKAEVLVFDEATSALDGATETAVMQSIDGLAWNLTVLIIAHRVSTLKRCDRVLNLDRGSYEWSPAPVASA
jgi:ABC-type multidrug transport system fused ATPase/permease subunit